MLIPIAVAYPILRGFGCLAQTVARSSMLWDIFRPTLDHKKLICTGVTAMCALASLCKAIR
jgi:multidrug transporter EmrE-like cation transporter